MLRKYKFNISMFKIISSPSIELVGFLLLSQSLSDDSRFSVGRGKSKNVLPQVLMEVVVAVQIAINLIYVSLLQ